MKCSDCQKHLPLYLHDECTLAQKDAIQAHVESCAACRAKLQSLQVESTTLIEAIGLERLPDSFTRSILDQLEPYPSQRGTDFVDDFASATPPSLSRKRRRSGFVWKRTVVAVCAAALLAITAGSFISPAFAAYISSFITRIGGELGLKRAAEQGFSIPANQSVTDQGITMRIKDIVADPTRLVVSYVLEDESGRILPNLFVPYYKDNRVYLTDSAGNMISESPSALQQGEGYADYMFMLKKPPNDLVVHIDITSLKPAAPKQGSWKLDVPVDLTKSMQAAKYIPTEESYSSPHGIDFTLEGVTYGPSATRFVIASRQTAEEKEQIERLTGPGGTMEGTSYGSYRLQYRIEDNAGQIVASQTINPPSGNRHIYFTPGYSSPPETDGDDAWRWYGAFVPAQAPEKLWFVLESIEKTELADFSLSFSPAALPGAPVTKRYDEYSTSFTVKQMTKGEDPTTNEPVWLITLSGTLTESDFPKWDLYDESGHSYEVNTDYNTSSVSGSIDSSILELDQTLIAKGMSSLPKQLTLSLKTIKKRYTDLNWKAAIPPER